MNWWQSIILGLVQGLTEFLPVSSSGHLVLMQNLLGISETDSMFFFVMLHFATLIAVVIAMWKPIKSLVRWPIKKEVWFLAIATVPAVIVGVFLNGFVESLFGGNWVWLGFLVTAALLLTTEIIVKVRQKKKVGQGAAAQSDKAEAAGAAVINENAPETADGSTSRSTAAGGELATVSKKKLLKARPSDIYTPSVSLAQAIVMGVAQGIAVVPGISRSGSTICAGMLSGGKRKNVADFSFIMSIPVILGSFVLELVKVDNWAGINFFNVALGMCAAFVSGLFAIKLMLALIQRVNYKWFSLYLLILAIVLLATGFMS